jgi:hypothetical protein
MPLAGRITAVVVGNQPHPTCFGCLAIQEGLDEPEVRNAAQVALIRDGLRVVNSTCHRCGQIADGLVSRDCSAGPAEQAERDAPVEI